jgi:outer membrane protein assembly factor BamA
MRGLVFVDLGNSFGEGTPFEWSVKRSAGLGIRFVSPLGAISLDWGWNLAKQPGEAQQKLHFSAGKSF